jgi:hypothetical protein
MYLDSFHESNKNQQEIPMYTVSTLQAKLLKLAIEMAKESRLAVKDEDVTLILRISGHDKQHEDWSTEISPDDWKKILAIKWDKNQRKVLKALRERNNEPLTGAEVEDMGVSLFMYGGHPITNAFQSHHLSFSFSPMGRLPKRRRRIEGRYRLFNKKPK